MTERYCVDTPLGRVTMTAEGEVLTGLWFEGQSCPVPELPPLTGDPGPALRQAERYLDLYFTGAEPSFAPPLLLRGTAFQLEVWALLRQIPFGGTVSYGQLAAWIAQRRGLPRMSARAVGAAVGRNPISVLVPCHRVVGTDGGLVGYAGGLPRKRLLLELERTRRPIPAAEAGAFLTKPIQEEQP